MRIVVVSSIAASLVRFRGDLLAAMVAKGAEVIALAPDFSDKDRRGLRAIGVSVADISLRRAGLNPFRDAIDFVRLIWRIRRLRPDMLFAYFVKPVIYAGLAARILRVPRRHALIAGLGYTYTMEGEGSWPRRILRRLVNSLFRVSLSSYDTVFFQNADDMRELVTAKVVDPGKARLVAGSGVNLANYPQSLPPEGEGLTFLLMARLLKEKGIREFVEAARRVRSSREDCRFIILGDVDPNPGGLRRHEMEHWVAEGVIEWPGHVTDVVPWLNECSIYVLPSYREGKPRSTQEALAVGRAVITTDVPGCRDTVRDGINGFLVPPRDAEALAAAMLRFVENRDLVVRMGAASRRMAEELFDVHAINEVFLNAMELSGDRASA